MFVVKTEDGQQRTLTPEVFAKKYRWQNNHQKVYVVAEPVDRTP